ARRGLLDQGRPRVVHSMTEAGPAAGGGGPAPRGLGPGGGPPGPRAPRLGAAGHTRPLFPGTPATRGDPPLPVTERGGRPPPPPRPPASRSPSPQSLVRDSWCSQWTATTKPTRSRASSGATTCPPPA